MVMVGDCCGARIDGTLDADSPKGEITQLKFLPHFIDTNHQRTLQSAHQGKPSNSLSSTHSSHLFLFSLSRPASYVCRGVLGTLVCCPTCQPRPTLSSSRGPLRSCAKSSLSISTFSDPTREVPVSIPRLPLCLSNCVSKN